MASVLNIDGYSLVEYLRVASDDGLDPVDADRLAPQFGEAAGGEGDPLISIHEGNAEHVWPLHLTPLKSGSFADTMDGLHLMVTDLNRRLAAAALVEWRMDGATSSTFHDVEHARFEPDFNYRKAQKLWVSGVLRVWAKPYGHTGTVRVIGTAGGSVGVLSVLASGIAGDTGAHLDVRLNHQPAGGATKFPGDALVAGVAVGGTLITASALWEIFGTKVGASGALGSQAVRNVYNDVVDFPIVRSNVVLNITERTRVIAFMRASLPASAILAVRAHDVVGNAYLDGATAVLERGREWRVVDLGVVPPPLPGAFVDVQVGVKRLGATGTVTIDCSGLFYMSEQSAVAFVEPVPIEVTGQTLDYPVGSYAISAASGYVYRTRGATTTQDWRSVEGLQRGAVPEVPVGTSRPLLAFAVVDDGPQNATVSVSIGVRERFMFGR